MVPAFGIKAFAHLPGGDRISVNFAAYFAVSLEFKEPSF